MKTRVIRRFSENHGAWVYWVQKWALWDAPDLRRAYPEEYDWRFIRIYPTEDDAVACAKRIAEHGRDPISAAGEGDDDFEVVHEFGR